MRRAMKVMLAAIVIAGMSGVRAQAEVKNRIGVGANYWHTLDDFDIKNFDQDGVSYYLSYQLRPASMMKFELDLEMMPENYGGAEDTVFAPQGYVILGGGIYAALGVGTYYTDGDFSSDPFFVLRAGLALNVLPFVWLDLNANYRFDDWNSITDVPEDLSTKTIMLGGAIRLEF